jgi:hypothetical protein
MLIEDLKVSNGTFTKADRRWLLYQNALPGKLI